jgi:hypothetical protein
MQPTAQELLEGELLCKQILEAKFPDLDLREGTALRDLVLRPSAMLFAMMKKGSDFYFTQNTLKGVDDITPPEVLDSILSNWFLTRNIGIKSIISARLYFARQKNISLSSDIYFSTDNTLKFYPTESTSYSSDSMIFDSYSNEYYIDIDMLAEKEGTEYNISSGSLLYFSNFDPYFLRAEINYLKNESINSETNSEFIDRSKTAISTRNLINIPSIDANLRAYFNYITRLLTVGMGDAEMIRDQIKAIFEAQTPRAVFSVVRSGSTVTVVMPDHNYYTGQKLLVEGSTPSAYNGTYSITVIDDNTFTYTIGTTPGVVTVVPSVSEVNDPILIHNGGMVDIYCSDKLATSTIQVSTDEFGKVELTGPIYSFKHSSVSGGDEEDSIPLTLEKNVSSATVSGSTVTVTTTTPHTFLGTESVTITGATQVKTLTSLTSVGITATATLNSHGYLVGNTVKITDAVQPTYNGTFTITEADTNTFKFILPASAITPATGTIHCEVDLVNGVKTPTITGANTFTFTLPQVSTTLIAGTIKASVPTRYTATNNYLESKPLTSISSAGLEVTVNMARHGYAQGRYITISGCAVSAYNGTWFIKTVETDAQFKFDLKTPVTNSATTGTITSVISWKDFGFSQKQALTIDFGSIYSNETVSFELNYFQNLDSIQSYLDSSSNRVLCADYLARGFNFYQLEVEVTSYNGVTPDATKVANIITSYLSGLGLGDMFVMSDMVSQLRLNGITNIQNPPLVTFKKYTRDLNPVETGTITDIMDPNDRTSVFLLENVSTFAENITVTNTAYTI